MTFLFDTNIILIYLRDQFAKQTIENIFNPFDLANVVLASVVTIGELKSFSLNNKWGKTKIQKMEELLLRCAVVDINTEDVLNRYAEIDAFSQGRLASKPLNLSARNMEKNDLWIPATASVLNATLLTTDNDFDHLNKEFLDVAKIELN